MKKTTKTTLTRAATLAVLLAAFSLTPLQAEPTSMPKAADSCAMSEKAWMEKSVAEYPLTTCVVSDEDLGAMGEGFDYVYKVEGKPDRLVRMCCSSCVKKFKKDPEKFLSMIDSAAEAKKSAAMKHNMSDMSGSHEGHQH